jgi:hypothetical protein
MQSSHSNHELCHCIDGVTQCKTTVDHRTLYQPGDGGPAAWQSLGLMEESMVRRQAPTLHQPGNDGPAAPL